MRKTLFTSTLLVLSTVIGSTWLEKVRINNTEVIFKIDTGAEVTQVKTAKIRSRNQTEYCVDLMETDYQ